MGTDSFVRPADTLYVFEFVDDVDSLTVDGAVVITTAHTASSDCVESEPNEG